MKFKVFIGWYVCRWIKCAFSSRNLKRRRNQWHRSCPRYRKSKWSRICRFLEFYSEISLILVIILLWTKWLFRCLWLDLSSTGLGPWMVFELSWLDLSSTSLGPWKGKVAQCTFEGLFILIPFKIELSTPYLILLELWTIYKPHMIVLHCIWNFYIN